MIIIFATIAAIAVGVVSQWTFKRFGVLLAAVTFVLIVGFGLVVDWLE